MLATLVFSTAIICAIIALYILGRPIRKRAIKPSGKAVLVTGAASGIGKHVVDILRREGCFVFAADLNAQALNDLYGSFDNVKTIVLDVCNQSQVDNAAKIIADHGKGLYGIVNSAGLYRAPGVDRSVIQGLAEIDVDKEVLPVFDVNVFGLLRITRAVFPLLFESKGCIINIASMAGRIPVAGAGAYAMSKAAVIACSDVMRRELKPYGLRVVSIEPGYLATPMVANQVCAYDKLDYSKTLLKKGRGDEATNSTLSITELASPALVAEVIVDSMFCQPAPPPHVIVDLLYKKRFYQVLTLLPFTWVDRILFGYEQRRKLIK